MKIIVSKNPANNKIDTKIDDVKEGQVVDLLVVVQWLAIALEMAINQSIAIRAKENSGKKILEPNVMQINKFKKGGNA